jgi:hypothetical protein
LLIEEISRALMMGYVAISAKFAAEVIE